MVDAREASESDYLNAEMVKSSKSKQATFMEEGMYVESTFDGKTTKRLRISVEIDGRTKFYKPNKDTVANLIEEYGSDTRKWIGKTAKLKVVKVMGKDSIIGEA